MKAARILAVTTLILVGILCTIRYLMFSDVSTGWLFLACAVVFSGVGILLLLHARFAPVFGFTVSLAGFLTGLFLIGPDTNDLFLGLIYFMEAIGAILCLFLLLGLRKREWKISDIN